MHDFIVLYGPTWDAPSRMSKHHLAEHWAKNGNRVLYVEAPFHPFSLATRPAEVLRLWKRYVRGPLVVSPRLMVQAYPVPYPFRSGFPLAGARRTVRWNQVPVRVQLRRLCKRLGFHNPIVVVGTATALPVLEALNPALVVYHCSDDYTQQSTFPRSVARLERDLIDQCDLVICTAEELGNQKAALHDATHVVTNGADVEHFASTSGVSEASDLMAYPSPRIGYIGTVFEWLDQPMIAAAARARPNWSFVFVGPIATDVTLLRKFDNVHFLGPRPYKVLPSYLRGLDVATVPFVRHPVTLRASPVKFYEYLASGVPVVATRLPDLEPFAHLTSLVSTPAEFATALEQAIATDSDGARHRRRRAAENHSWTVRFKQVDALIAEACQRTNNVLVHGGSLAGDPA